MRLGRIRNKKESSPEEENDVEKDMNHGTPSWTSYNNNNDKTYNYNDEEELDVQSTGTNGGLIVEEDYGEEGGIYDIDETFEDYEDFDDDYDDDDDDDDDDDWSSQRYARGITQTPNNNTANNNNASLRRHRRHRNNTTNNNNNNNRHNSDSLSSDDLFSIAFTFFTRSLSIVVFGALLGWAILLTRIAKGDPPSTSWAEPTTSNGQQIVRNNNDSNMLGNPWIGSNNGNGGLTSSSLSCTSPFESKEIFSLKNSTTVEHVENGAVATDDKRCSDIGLSILQDHGGNAIDATIASALCLGVVNPVSSGIGGGAFMLIHVRKDDDLDNGVVTTGMDDNNDNNDEENGNNNKDDADFFEEGYEMFDTYDDDGNNDDDGDGNDDDDFGDDRRRRRNNKRRRRKRSLQNDGPAFEDFRKKKDDKPSNNENENEENNNENNEKETELGVKYTTEFIDCRETAPSEAHRDMYEHLPTSSSVDGGLAIAIPGELRGLELAHYRHGSLPFDMLVEPAAKLAENGFIVSRNLAHDIETMWKKLSPLGDEDDNRLRALCSKRGEGLDPLEQGDTMKRPTLGRFLRTVMERGVNDAFYDGDMAETLASEIRDAGGIMTADDIRNYKPAIRDPLISYDVDGFAMVGAPPPSSGGAVVVGASRFLAGYAAPASSVLGDTLSKHRLVEAMKHVFAMRMSLGDPAFFMNETTDVTNDLIGGEYISLLRRMTKDDDVLPLSKYGGPQWALLKDTTTTPTGDRKRQLNRDDDDDEKEVDRDDDETKHESSFKTLSKEEEEEEKEESRRKALLFQYLEDHGTTHLTVVDKHRNAVAMTSTVNTKFGSKVLSPSTGIIFNNQMDDFSTPGRPNHFGLEPSEANYIVPGKRPLSSMSPTMVFHHEYDPVRHDETMYSTSAISEWAYRGIDRQLGDLVLAIGGSGGPKIITAVLQVMINHLFMGMPLFDAIVHPRLHDQLLYKEQATTLYEDSYLLSSHHLFVSDRTKDAIERRGHFAKQFGFLGAVQAVAVDIETDRLTAVSDVRKDGAPAGY